MARYKGWVGGRGWGGGWDRVGNRRRVISSTRTQAAVPCLQQVTETDSIHGISRDSRWQQSGTTHILINAIHWPQRPCSAP